MEWLTATGSLAWSNTASSQVRTTRTKMSGLNGGFSTGQDFIPISGNNEGQDYATQKPEAGVNRGFVPGGNRVDHIISLDMAKEISMIQRTDKGKQARQYFIECERRAKQPVKQLPPGVSAGGIVRSVEW
ncbi:antA/AntB antirepressor family protein [Corynebacterium phoceense]|uniref:antA/AntB antirepressor family protein n=1 Tax=Corynebacterium phoceense TaxID=1686286 RepID=UPI00211C0FDD|nr:antA/AntB antirepressor family protein [Corynebacterium phoceense]MCQ9335351.1 antA/AntB antirepressor family protein [Corynebacterium phoceense]